MEFVTSVDTDGNPLYTFNIPNQMNYSTSVIYDGKYSAFDLGSIIDNLSHSIYGKKSIYDCPNSFKLMIEHDNDNILKFVTYPPNSVTLYLNHKKCLNALMSLYREVTKLEIKYMDEVEFKETAILLGFQIDNEIF